MSESEEIEAPLPELQKVDPESLVLRGRPRPVVRFRRGVIIGSVVVVSATLVILTWVALEPRTFHIVADGESGRPFERAVPEAVAGAPRDYRAVPLLGPPLPGDLGRPILEQKRKLGEASPRSASPVANGTSERAADIREQRAAAEQSARASSIVVHLSDGHVGVGQSTSTVEPPPDQPRFPNAATSPGQSDANLHALAPPVSSWTISAGTVIPASLLTGLNSDLPGMVLAQVTENVRDSASGRVVLIPQGAKLIGRYDSSLSYGQRRALVVWQRILFPDGSSLRLNNLPASDVAGYSGLTDRVDGHSWQLLKGVVLSSLLGVGTQLSLGGERGIVRAIRESAQQNGSQAGEQILSKGLSVQPTIKVRPGWPVRVLVSEDLSLEPWKGEVRTE